MYLSYPRYGDVTTASVDLQVGSLGLPGTQWQKGTKLNAEIHARGLSTLLWELLEREELCAERHKCIILLGLGCGANALLRFVATYLSEPRFSSLRSMIQALAVVNPFPLTSNSSESSQIRKSVEALKQVLESGNHHEQLQSIATAFFSADYILRVSGRDLFAGRASRHGISRELKKSGHRLWLLIAMASHVRT